MTPEHWHRLAVSTALASWSMSLKRPDLSERDRVVGALEAYRRQIVALEIVEDAANGNDQG